LPILAFSLPVLVGFHLILIAHSTEHSANLQTFLLTTYLRPFLQRIAKRSLIFAPNTHANDSKVKQKRAFFHRPLEKPPTALGA